MRRVRVYLAIALLSCGCLEKIGVGRPDAGLDGDGDGGGLDVRADVSLDASGEDDASEPEDGATGSDGAVEDGGAPPPPLRFGTMAVPDDQISTLTIWGRSSDELYAGTANGNVLAFDPDVGWAVAWHEPNNFGIVRIRGTDQRLFIASEASLHVHQPGLGESVTSHSVGRAIHDLHVVSDSEAYLVSELNNGRAVFRWDGSGVDVMNDQLDVAALYGVFVDDGGTLFVTGNGKIFRFESQTWLEDPIDWPAGFGIADIANFDLYDVSRVGPDLFAVGDEHHVLRWSEGAGRWEFVYEPNAGEYLAALGALSGGEAYAVGRSGSSGPIVRFSDGVWSYADYSEYHNFYDLFVAGPDEIFVAGVVGSTLEPVILRGFR